MLHLGRLASVLATLRTNPLDYKVYKCQSGASFRKELPVCCRSWIVYKRLGNWISYAVCCVAVAHPDVRALSSYDWKRIHCKGNNNQTSSYILKRKNIELGETCYIGIAPLPNSGDGSDEQLATNLPPHPPVGLHMVTFFPLMVISWMIFRYTYTYI